MGPYPAAAAAPAPALDPPVVRLGSRGERVIPCREDTPEESIPQSGIVVEPRMTAPASSRRSVIGASWSATGISTQAWPLGSGTPRRAMFSLIVTGTPSRSLNGRPSRQRAALAAAASRERSSSRWNRALMVGSHASMRSTTAECTSIGSKSPPANPAAISAALRSASDVVMCCPFSRWFVAPWTRGPSYPAASASARLGVAAMRLRVYSSWGFA